MEGHQCVPGKGHKNQALASCDLIGSVRNIGKAEREQRHGKQAVAGHGAVHISPAELHPDHHAQTDQLGMVVRVMVAVHPGHDLLNLPRAVSRCIAGVHTGVENGAVDHQKDRPAPKQDPFIPWGPHSGYRFRLSAHVRADGQENLPEQQESACQHKHQLQAGMQLLKGTAAAPKEQTVVCKRNSAR